MNPLRALLLLFSLLIIFPGPLAYAQDEPELADQERLESVMTNVGNQFIYAFFGKDILAIYLTDSDDVKAVKAATDTQLSGLTAPFNPLSGKFMLGGLTLIYALSVGYFILRLSFFLLENLWLWQKHKDPPLTDREFRGISIKMVLLGGLVLIPIPLTNDISDERYLTSVSIGGLFHLLGVSHDTADGSVKSLIESQRQTLKTVVLPAADAKQFEMMSVNEFFTCLAMQPDNVLHREATSTVEFYKEDGDTVLGVVSWGHCTLNIGLGIDTHGDEKIEKLLQQDPSLPLLPGLFDRGQKEMFTTVLTEVFAAGRRNAEWLSMPIHSSEFREGSDLMLPYTGEVLSASELDDWADQCDAIGNLNWSEHTSISGYDRSVFHIWSSRCMSREVTSKMLYPDSYGELDKLLNEGNSRQPAIALCVDQASLSQVLTDSRFSAQYTSNAGGAASNTVESISLNSCLSSICSANSVASGGMYACANAIDLYESNLRDSQLVERGTMTLGFYMFNLFVHQPPSSLAKEVFNRFSFEFENRMNFESSEDEDKELYLTVPFQLPKFSSTPTDWDEVIIQLQNAIGRSEMPAVTPVMEMTDLPGWLGYSRLLTCAQSPLQVSNGYVCNNLPQEFSRFGFSLLQNAITIKTLMTIGNTTNLLRMPSVPGGTIGKEVDTNAAKTFLLSTAMTVAVGQSGVADKLYEKVGGLSFAGTDEFGHLDRSEMSVWLESPLMVGLLALGKMSSESGVVKFIEYVLLGVLLMGVLFAFLMPLFPMLMVISALSKFAYLLLKSIMFTGFRLTDAVFESDPDFIGEQLDKVVAEWLSVLLKLPLLVVGIMLAWLMSNVVVGHVISSINLMVPTNDGVKGVLDLIVVLVFTGIVIFIIYNMVLTVIESFYDFTVEWILGTLTNSPFADRRAVGWKDSKDILHLIGR